MSSALLYFVALAFNQHASARITGFQVDYEFCSGTYKTLEDKLNQIAVCNAWLSELSILKETTHHYGLNLTVTAGTWMACTPGMIPPSSCFNITFNGINQSIAEHVIDIADRTVLMDYDVDEPRIVERAAPFLSIANGKPQKHDSIVVGLAIAPYPPNSPPLWYTLRNESVMKRTMWDLHAKLSSNPSFHGFAVFDSQMWRHNSLHAPDLSSAPFPRGLESWGVNHTVVLNPGTWSEWISWARVRNVTTLYVGPHVSDIDLIAVPGVEGSKANEKMFCEFIRQAHKQGLDVMLDDNGGLIRGARPNVRWSWNLIDLVFVSNCTMPTSPPTAFRAR